MSESQGFFSRVVARVRAILPEHWRGTAGKRYRQTIETVSDYSKENIRIRERLNQAPDVVANTLKLKSNESLLKAAEEENKRIATDLARQTLSDKARQEKATADRMETESRMAKVKEVEARIMLVDKLRAANCFPIWDKDGNMRVMKAPPDYDWDGLTRAVIQTNDLFPTPEPAVAANQPSSQSLAEALASGRVIATVKGTFSGDMIKINVPGLLPPRHAGSLSEGGAVDLRTLDDHQLPAPADIDTDGAPSKE